MTDDFSTEQGVNTFLERISEEVFLTNEYMFILGKEVKNAILNPEELLGKDTQEILKEAFCQAIEMFGEKEYVDPLESMNVSEQAKTLMRVIRGSFLGAIGKMKLHNNDELAESLVSFNHFLFNFVCEEQEKVPCLRFIALSMISLEDT